MDWDTEYAWENLIICLSRYRNAVSKLTKSPSVAFDAKKAIEHVDHAFTLNEENTFRALETCSSVLMDTRLEPGADPPQEIET
jgi:hypothetical protein